MRTYQVTLPFSQRELNKWKKERDKAVKSYDVEKFKKFYHKWEKRGIYNYELPSDEALEISLRKMVYHTASATPEEKAEALKWLLEHGCDTHI